MNKSLLIVLGGVLIAFNASAHAVVKPDSVGIGSTQVFVLAVPSERNMSTVAVRLMIPDGLKSVTPNVRAGWKITVKTVATGQKITNDEGVEVDEMKPTEIDWTGGLIPAGQRDELKFLAQVPATPTVLPWKVYQTYQDGSVVAWDQTPASGAKTPYSTTAVVNDLLQPKVSWWQANQINLTLGVSLLALVISLAILIKHKQ